jgi:hypothetical protein
MFQVQQAFSGEILDKTSLVLVILNFGNIFEYTDNFTTTPLHTSEVSCCIKATQVRIGDATVRLY